MADIIIIGAGASGMAAAWKAALAGARVTVLEQFDRPGKKLLMTGNGRCNITHLDDAIADRYHSSESDLVDAFAHKVFDKVSVEETLAFLRTAGIVTTDKDGYVYPRSLKASSVLALLLRKLESLGVRMKYSCPVTGISFHEGKWTVSVPGWSYEADSVIIAGGSPAGLGDVPDTMEALCRSNSIAFTEFAPALTALNCTMPKWYNASGERTDAVLTLYTDDKTYKEAGQVQWTDKGISGIACFNLSTFAGEALENGKKAEIGIDFFPEIAEKELADMIRSMTEGVSAKATAVALSALIPERIADLLLGPVTKKTVFEADKLAASFKNYKLKVSSLRRMNASQVCRGGISLSNIDPDTMQIRSHEGLYACGEVIDADGPCGGYNLQWAWSTGMIAGESAAERK